MTKFYQHHLNQVSRSFAICTPKLQQPLREWISLTYLLCRILDTVEDSHWTNKEDQDLQFSQFLELTTSSQTPALFIKKWVQRFPSSLPESEKELVKETPLLLKNLHHTIPLPIKQHILNLLEQMTLGMKIFSQKPISNLRELNKYCYYVAGIVGETLHHFLVFCSPELNQPSFFKKACEFGLFLQKINILKDQQKDEKEGRHFIPNRKEVLSSLSSHAQKAFSYIKSLPSKHQDFRLFCSISLFLGLSSLPYIQNSFHLKEQIKISRAQTFKLIQALEENISQPAFMEHLFQESLTHL
ncbi:MAG: hypothetical protein D6797_08125 [Bdellovibrio sp.]|nr:MAG: hypothetical protein D6797_08125 [Bdellovibrio sp.]